MSFYDQMLLNYPGLLGGGAGTQTGTTTTQNIIYPTTYPQAQQIYQHPAMIQVPVITDKYPEKLHFMDSEGAIHSYSVEEIYKLLGLKW
jgi:hypothetical protein